MKQTKRDKLIISKEMSRRAKKWHKRMKAEDPETYREMQRKASHARRKKIKHEKA